MYSRAQPYVSNVCAACRGLVGEGRYRTLDAAPCLRSQHQNKHSRCMYYIMGCPYTCVV